MIKQASSYYINCYTWVQRNSKKLQIILILLIIARFVIINYFNWTTGYLANGVGGVQSGADSPRYISGAEQLINHLPLRDSQLRYIGYIGIISFAKLSHLGLGFVVVLQLLFALLSSFALYSMSKSITSSPIAGIIAAGLYLVNPFIVTWHLYIHTESLYFSFLILSAWSIHKFVEKKNVKYFLFSLIIIAIAASIRPNGWVLFPILLVSYVIFSGLKKQFKIIGIAIILFSFLFFLIFARSLNNSIQENEIDSMLYNGVVVWGHKELNIKMPYDSEIQNKNWKNCYSYILSHPIATAKLGIMRISSELFQIHKPFLSQKLKLRFLFWLVPFYILALIGYLYYSINKILKISMLIILAHIFVITITWADHESRFILYILALIQLLGVCGIIRLAKGAYHFASEKSGRD